jgi:hypothetical protein
LPRRIGDGLAQPETGSNSEPESFGGNDELIREAVVFLKFVRDESAQGKFSSDLVDLLECPDRVAGGAEIEG